MSIFNSKLSERTRTVVALAPVVPSSSTTSYVNVSLGQRLTILVIGSNDSTGTASAIALQQATKADGTGAKALAFTTVDANTDVASNGDTFTATAVTSNTFNTTSTASKNFAYLIDVKGDQLDVANKFNYVNVTVGNAAHTTLTVVYLLDGLRWTDGPKATA